MRLCFFSVGSCILLLAGCGQHSTPPSVPSTGGTNTPAPAAQTATSSVPTNMVLVAAGQFIMGEKSEPDAPPHPVTLSAFLIDRHLVTQEFYEKLMGSNPSRWKGAGLPVEQVRWSDAVRFCNKRSEAEGLRPCYNLTTWQCDFAADGYRLPTEAEWEYACRAGTTTAYVCGDSPAKLGEFAWFDRNSGGRPQPVGKKQPNAWGLYDMCGNLWQWCQDFYQPDGYGTAAVQDPHGPSEGPNKVVRGGAWRFGAETCRSGYRYNESPGYSDVCFGYDIYGFRCVRRAPSK